MKKAGVSDRKFSQDDNVYCYVDDTTKVNTFVLTTYNPSDSEFDAFKNTVVNCINEFDKNTYPIQIILKQNGGGIANLELAIQKVKELQYMLGGTIVFLETLRNEKLMEFYTHQHGFKEFDTRRASSMIGTEFVQLLGTL